MDIQNHQRTQSHHAAPPAGKSPASARRELFEAEDEIDRQRGEMIAGVEARLRQTSRRQSAFIVRWQVP